MLRDHDFLVGRDHQNLNLAIRRRDRTMVSRIGIVVELHSHPFQARADVAADIGAVLADATGEDL
jgi:hypothetical protein